MSVEASAHSNSPIIAYVMKAWEHADPRSYQVKARSNTTEKGNFLIAEEQPTLQNTDETSPSLFPAQTRPTARCAAACQLDEHTNNERPTSFATMCTLSFQTLAICYRASRQRIMASRMFGRQRMGTALALWNGEAGRISERT